MPSRVLGSAMHLSIHFLGRRGSFALHRPIEVAVSGADSMKAAADSYAERHYQI